MYLGLPFILHMRSIGSRDRFLNLRTNEQINDPQTIDFDNLSK